MLVSTRPLFKTAEILAIRTDIKLKTNSSNVYPLLGLDLPILPLSLSENHNLTFTPHFHLNSSLNQGLIVNIP